MSGFLKAFWSGTISALGVDSARDYTITDRKDRGTSSPVLSADQMERLRKLDPAYVKAFIEHAEKERRRDLIYRLARQVCVLILGSAGVAVGCFLAYTNPDTFYAGISIAVVYAAVLAIAFIRGRE